MFLAKLSCSSAPPVTWNIFMPPWEDKNLCSPKWFPLSSTPFSWLYPESFTFHCWNTTFLKSCFKVTFVLFHFSCVNWTTLTLFTPCLLTSSPQPLFSAPTFLSREGMYKYFVVRFCESAFALIEFNKLENSKQTVWLEQAVGQDRAAPSQHSQSQTGASPIHCAKPPAAYCRFKRTGLVCSWNKHCVPPLFHWNKKIILLKQKRAWVMLQFPSHCQQKKIQTWSFAFHFVKVGFFCFLWLW